MKDGGPAFPHREYESRPFYHGMTLRDWFAGMAMQGLLSGLLAATGNNDTGGDWLESDQWVPAQAYLIADAMIGEKDDR